MKKKTKKNSYHKKNLRVKKNKKHVVKKKNLSRAKKDYLD